MVYRARGQLGVGGVGGLSDLRGGKRTSLERFTVIEGIRPETRANPVKEPPGGVRTTEPAPGEMAVSLKPLRARHFLIGATSYLDTAAGARNQR
jgi:hypothetical protein